MKKLKVEHAGLFSNKIHSFLNAAAIPDKIRGYYSILKTYNFILNVSEGKTNPQSSSKCCLNNTQLSVDDTLGKELFQ